MWVFVYNGGDVLLKWVDFVDLIDVIGVWFGEWMVVVWKDGWVLLDGECCVFWVLGFGIDMDCIVLCKCYSELVWCFYFDCNGGDCVYEGEL